MSRNLLAIPNDPLHDYYRSDEFDFLTEYNPLDVDGRRFFDGVSFLNWRDDFDGEYCGIRSYSFLSNKVLANKLLLGLASGEISFSSVSFRSLFEEDISRIKDVISVTNPCMVRAFNTHFAAELGRIVADIARVPLVVSAHDPSRLSPFVSLADSLVCVSDNLADLCVEDFCVDPKKIKVIYDAVDMDGVFYPRNIADCLSVVGGLPVGEGHVLSVGRLVPNKNIETLLEALSIVGSVFPGLKHIHLGSGTEDSKLFYSSRISELGLGGVSFFAGSVQKKYLPFFYSWADVYALPTLWEGLGRAQLESLACGTPVITTDLPPMNTIVKDGFNGYLIDPSNPSAIAKRIMTVLTNQNLKKRLSSAARFSVKKYSSTEIMASHCENYNSLLRP